MKKVYIVTETLNVSGRAIDSKRTTIGVFSSRRGAEQAMDQRMEQMAKLFLDWENPVCVRFTKEGRFGYWAHPLYNKYTCEGWIVKTTPWVLQ